MKKEKKKEKEFSIFLFSVT